MLPGKYRIYLPDTGSTVGGWRDVDIHVGSKVIVSSATSALPYTAVTFVGRF